MAPTIRSAPPGIFLRHPHHQPLGFLVNSGTTRGFAKLRSVELVGDELSVPGQRSEEHTSELQSHHDLVCRLLLEKKKTPNLSTNHTSITTYYTLHMITA